MLLSFLEMPGVFFFDSFDTSNVLLKRSTDAYHDRIDVSPTECTKYSEQKKFPAAMSIPKTRRFADSSARRDNNRRIIRNPNKAAKFLECSSNLQRSILKCRKTHFVQIFISNQTRSFQYVLLILRIEKCNYDYEKILASLNYIIISDFVLDTHS